MVDALTAIIVPPPAPWFVVRRALADARFALGLNPSSEEQDEPDGAQGLGVSKTFKTPSARESNNS
jgi:hypothetical protein